MPKEINERNAIALDQAQQRQQAQMDEHSDRLQRLEMEILALKQELASVKAIALSSIGRGSTG